MFSSLKKVHRFGIAEFFTALGNSAIKLALLKLIRSI